MLTPSDDSREGLQFRAELQSVLDACEDGITCFSPLRDADGQVIDFTLKSINSAGCSLHGAPAAHLVGQRMTKLLPALEPALFDSYVAVVNGGPTYREEQFYSDGRYDGWFLVIGARSAAGDLVVVIRTITAIKQREAELRRVADMISHDLAGPVGQVAAFAELLRRKGAASLDPDILAYLAHIQDGCLAIGAIIGRPAQQGAA
jgi:nitrogen fixation/metabolism regulation signal transduction histidine kinase